MKAMILAAGRGERMKELTADRPKPLLEVGGKALIEHHLSALSLAGINEIVINLSYRGDAIRERLGGGERYGVSILYSDEGEPPLETGGGIVRALAHLGAKPFLLVNSDVLTDLDYGAFARAARCSTLVLVPNPQHHPLGDFGLDSAGFVTAAPPLLTYAGVAVLDPDLFAGLPPGRRQLKPVLDAAIERRELRGFRHDGYWLDVGTRERLEAARIATQRGR
jgi:MurNAc alpha-1-phosphate uridylyltransferase